MPQERYSHEHLVSTVGINILVIDVLDRGAASQATDSGAAALVAPNALNLMVRRRILDRDTFVAVGDLDVVNPDVRARHVYAVGTADVGATNRKIVHLSVLRVVENHVELGGWSKMVNVVCAAKIQGMAHSRRRLGRGERTSWK